jgi:heme-degrading monooxygenase HmoA
MYATVRKYTGTELVDVLVQNEDTVRGLLTGIDGFKAYYLLRTDDGTALSVSVYDDQSGVEESNRQAADWVRQNAADAAGQADVSAGEVVLSF